MVQAQAHKRMLREALDLAALNGLLRLSPDGHLIHVPFALSPFSMKPGEVKLMEWLTAPFGEMMLRISRDCDFILGQLEPL
ncbi:MAG: hypothetical protein QF814_04305, partial [Candidatus Marinimicrobia bacterium]|nr:hypothetical protein [Candidatus Neomarinimicrobiota bacterium]